MSENWIFFVDTNIFLDFYRQSGSSAHRQLRSLEKHTDRLITGDQVRMEFMKNRQRVIIKALKELRAPSQEAVPQILSDLKSAEMLGRHQASARKSFQEIVKKAEAILQHPSRHDSVYKTFNRIFDANSELNLRRPKPERLSVRELAQKRCLLGYPPRKDQDQSIGDAINWEWILHCANEVTKDANVMLVSRDGDYGAHYGQNSYLNDWLRREFTERVGVRRKIVLTTKLTDALKRMDEIVTEDDIIEEKHLIARRRTKLSLVDLYTRSLRGRAAIEDDYPFDSEADFEERLFDLGEDIDPDRELDDSGSSDEPEKS